MNLNLSKSCQIVGLDQIYLNYFGRVGTGTFVEVGAYDGEEFSNTSCLADIGWNGIYVEPVKEFYEKCLNRHKCNNVFVENCFIGKFEGEVDLYIEGTITTTSINQVDLYKSINWSREITESKCNQITLNSLLQKYKVPPKFELLVVDVEGNETDVFDSFDFGYYLPKMVIVELVDLHDEFKTISTVYESNVSLRNTIKNFGYKEIYKDHINTIFIFGEL